MKNVSFILLLLISHISISQSFIWEQQRTFPGGARSEAISFVLGDTAYVGTGRNSSDFFKDFHKYDQVTDTWTQISDFPGDARYGAVAFSIGGKGYVGTGTDGTNEFKDFYAYDPTSGSWTAVADFGGSARHFAASFALDEMGYVGTGRDDTDETSDFYRYDPTANTWSLVASLGTDNLRQEATGFSISDKGYISSGFVITDDFATIVYSDVFEYDASTNSWTNKVFADVKLSNKQSSAALVLDGKAYLIGGSNTNSAIIYDPSDNALSNIYTFGPSSEDNRRDLVAFTVNGVGFAGLGVNAPEVFESEYRNDLWQLTTIESPEAPTNIFVSTLEKTSARIFWTDNSTDEDGFLIYLSEATDDNFQIQDTTTSRSYSFSDLTEGTKYYTRVAAYRDTLTSEFLSDDFRTRSDLPAEPDGLSIQASLFQPGFLLSWNDNSINEDGFFIERATSPDGPFTSIDSVNTSRTEFTDADTSLLLNTTYYYRVTAFNDFGNSAPTTVVQKNTTSLEPKAPLIEIDALEDARPTSSDDFLVRIGRLENAERVTHYIDQMAFDGEFTGSDSTQFLNTTFGMRELETRSFRYIVHNKFGSDTSNVITVTAGLANPKTVRVNFSADNIIALRFTPGSWRHIGTNVERSENGGEFLQIADYKREDYFQVNSLGTVFFDSTVQASNQYAYRLKNYNETFMSNYSLPDSAIAKKTGVWKKVEKNDLSVAVDSLDAFKIRRQFYADGKVYLLSLENGSFISYEVGSGIFATLPDFPNSSSIEGHITGINDGLIYVFGGPDVNNDGALENWVFNVSNESWSQISDLPNSLRYSQHDPIFASDGHVYLSGNDDSFDFNVVRYNITNDSFETFVSSIDDSLFPSFAYAEGDSISFINSSGRVIDGVVIPEPSQSFNITTLTFNSFTVRHILSSARINELVTYQNLNFWINPRNKRSWTYDNLSDLNLTYAGPITFPPFSSFSDFDDNINGIAFVDADTLYYGFGRFERSSRSFRGLFYLDDKNSNGPIHFRADSITDTSAILRWFDPDQDTDGYILEEFNQIVNDFVVIDSLEAGVRSYKVTSLEQDTFYNFYIRSYQGDKLSDQNSHFFNTLQVYPNRVDNLSAEVLSDTSVKLNWAVNNEVPFDEIVISEINSNLNIALTNEDSTFTITDLDEGISYGFEVTSTNEAGSASSFISARTLLGTPEISNIRILDDHYVVIWNDNSGFETNFIVQRKLVDEDIFSSIDTLGQTELYLDQGSIINENEYIYRIQALQLEMAILDEKDTLILRNYSDYSNEASSVLNLLILNVENVDGIKVYPNPVSNELHFSSDVNEPWEMLIIDMDGKVQMRTFATPQSSWNISALKPGLYFLNLKHKNGRSQFKLVKK